METCTVQNFGEVFPWFFMIFGCFWALVVLATVVISIIAFCSICRKAGFSWALGLLVLVPVGNLILILYLAFADWPILKRLRGLESTAKAESPGHD